MGKEEKFFKNLSDRERSIFEGAITMGALFHQFVGTPINLSSVETLENAIKEAMELQPCIEEVKISIDRDKLTEIDNEFAYVSLTGEMLNVKIIATFNGYKAVHRLHFIDELNYPLMYVEKFID